MKGDGGGGAVEDVLQKNQCRLLSLKTNKVDAINRN